MIKIFGHSGRNPVRKLNVNTREFYDKHPDLMPRNIYLYLGRVVTREEIDKKFNQAFKVPFTTKVKFWLKNLFKDTGR